MYLMVSKKPKDIAHQVETASNDHNLIALLPAPTSFREGLDQFVPHGSMIT